MTSLNQWIETDDGLPYKDPDTIAPVLRVWMERNIVLIKRKVFRDGKTLLLYCPSGSVSLHGCSDLAAAYRHAKTLGLEMGDNNHLIIDKSHWSNYDPE